jgi:hypothetical protein
MFLYVLYVTVKTLIKRNVGFKKAPGVVGRDGGSAPLI